jgi:hypothetical protein
MDTHGEVPGPPVQPKDARSDAGVFPKDASEVRLGLETGAGGHVDQRQSVLRNRSLARSIRCPVMYACGGCPTVCLNARAK